MMLAVPEIEAQEPEIWSRNDMLVEVGLLEMSAVLWEKRFVWKRRSMPPDSCSQKVLNSNLTLLY